MDTVATGGSMGGDGTGWYTMVKSAALLEHPLVEMLDSSVGGNGLAVFRLCGVF